MKLRCQRLNTNVSFCLKCTTLSASGEKKSPFFNHTVVDIFMADKCFKCAFCALLCVLVLLEQVFRSDRQ